MQEVGAQQSNTAHLRPGSWIQLQAKTPSPASGWETKCSPGETRFSLKFVIRKAGWVWRRAASPRHGFGRLFQVL